MSISLVLYEQQKQKKDIVTLKQYGQKGLFQYSPAHLMLHYLTLRLQLSKTQKQLSSAPQASLFQLLDGTIVTIKDLRHRFNILCADMGLDPTRYTIYSFRIGGATSLAQRCVDHRMIQIAAQYSGFPIWEISVDFGIFAVFNRLDFHAFPKFPLVFDSICNELIS